MRAKLTAELDELIAVYISYRSGEHIEGSLPSRKFPHVYKLLEAIRDIDLTSD